MRLTEDQIKQGLLHADMDVRTACLAYFSEAYSRDQTIMPVAIEALERFGHENAFRYFFYIAKLSQTEETIRWAVGELKNPSRDTDKEHRYSYHLSALLCRADPRLLGPHEKEILSCPGFQRDLVERFTNHLKFLSWDGATLWRELEAICEEGKDKTYIKDTRYEEGKQIVEALAREGDRHTERMMSLLRVKIENHEKDPMKWMECLMVCLAGMIRHEAAVPLLVEKLHQIGELLSEECLEALIKIGTDSVVQEIQKSYPAGTWHFRLYASGLLANIHTDSAVAAGIELLGEEPDPELENFLAQSLAKQFSYEGNEAGRKVLLDDPDLFDLMWALVPSCTLTGQNFPELEEWRKEVVERLRPKPVPKAVQAPALRPAPAPALPHLRTQPLTKKKKVGRNDPCPCGSGKKFKHCCLNK